MTGSAVDALLYFLLWAGFFFVIMRLGCGAHVAGHAGNSAGSKSGAPDQLRWIPPETDTDPVCGKTVRPEQSKPSVYDGIVYYFCSRDCRERFEAAPHLYVGTSVSQDQNGQEDPHVSGAPQHTHV